MKTDPLLNIGVLVILSLYATVVVIMVLVILGLLTAIFLVSCSIPIDMYRDYRIEKMG